MTLFIKNAKILNIDKDKKLDILISGNKISAIGNFYNKKADKIIDAEGIYVSYGFIDIYNELDHNFQIFSKKFNFVAEEGISNILVGHSGLSLTPILNTQIDDFKKYSSGYSVNINWQDLNQFYNFLNKQKLNFNIKTLIGFENLKYFILKNKYRQLNKKEFFNLSYLLKEILTEKNSIGFSLDWESIQLDLINLNQLENIAKIVSEKSKILSITLPREKKIEDIIKILLEIISKTNVKILLNNYLTDYLTHKDNLNILSQLDKFYPNIFFTVNSYQVESLLIYKLLPLRIRKNNLEEILNIISDSWFIKRIIDEMPNFDFEKLFIFQTENNLKHHILNNKNLKAITEIYEMENPKLAILKIMQNTKLRDVIFYNNIDLDILIDALLSKNSLFGSGWFYLYDNKKVFLDFCNLILHYKLMSLNNLIQKVTVLPYKFLEFKNYSHFEIGNTADLVGFDVINNEINIKFVIHDGKIIFEKDQKDNSNNIDIEEKKYSLLN